MVNNMNILLGRVESGRMEKMGSVFQGDFIKEKFTFNLFSREADLSLELLCDLGALKLRNGASPFTFPSFSLFKDILTSFRLDKIPKHNPICMQFVATCSVQPVESTANLRSLLPLIRFKCEVNPLSRVSPAQHCHVYLLNSTTSLFDIVLICFVFLYIH